MQCSFCEWRCELNADSHGFCRMYYADQGEIRERFPNRWSYAVSRVESLPFYHAYPGDVEIESNRWVTDTALDLIDGYEPQLACVFYAQQYFAGRYTPMSEEQRKIMIEHVFAEIGRFIEKSGYTPVMVGSGDLVELAGEIDMSKVDGIAISSHWSGRYAGLHRASSRDLDYAASHSAIERAVGRDEWIRLFPEAPYRAERIPEYLLVAREGWTFA
jgi:hypothetical protein